MSARIPDDINAFMNKYKVTPDEIWLVPGGKSYAIKHGALERIAAQEKIAFNEPKVIEADGAAGIATILVSGALGSETAWSFGEASPKNNKNAYCWAMAEKRAKGRVILKLLKSHGAIYSEDEADDFKQQAEPSTVKTFSRDRSPREAYFLLCLDIIKHFKASAADLRAWWEDEKKHREDHGIVNGEADYAALFTAFKDKGLSLASMSNIRSEEAA